MGIGGGEGVRSVRSGSTAVTARMAASATVLPGWTIQASVCAALAAGLLGLVWIYNNGLRDPRYLDGWILAGGMLLQMAIHIARKTTGLSPRSAQRWRKLHIFLGYLLIAAFISHADFSLPDTAFEAALWACFVLIAVSGIFGAWLARSRRAERQIEGVGYEAIPAHRAELAQQVQALISSTDPSLPLPLPRLPHDDWIADLYTNRLQWFFKAPRNSAAHFFGSQLPLERMISEIDALSGYVDQRSREKLAAIKDLVREKDRLDATQVHLELSRAWLLVHVPVTYAVIVLTVLHVVVVYSYSSGAW